ncbi:MAG TPA: DsbA family oxidoreductase, partial [Hyphomicrobiales bacterium]|nr:DsbA family oxidoreductase [Hyphomicrobiales bacterium]
TIDVVSDVMCPWCYIGKRRLEAAAAALPEVGLDVQWRPFQLDATIPPEGMDRRMYLERKFGGADAAERVYAPMRAAGEAESIPFAFDRIRRSPNTITAHRLIRWAGQAGLQEEMVERLFRLYFIEGGDLTDPAVLAKAAAEAGMEHEVAERLLASEADTAEVRADIEAAQNMGITGVPTFIGGGRYAVVGAQPADVLADAIAKARAEAPAVP